MDRVWLWLALTTLLTISPTVVLAQIDGFATHYGAHYQGRPLGCSGFGTYDTDNPYILAVSPARYADWPCGHKLLVTGPAGSHVVVRSDSCPGCHRNTIDLSEAGVLAVCGGVHTCEVTIHDLGRLD